MIDYATITTSTHTITLYGEPRDYTLHLEIAVEDHATGTITTTASSEDWPTIERVFPRHRWPHAIFAGKHHEERWDVPAEFTTAIQTAIENEVDALISEYNFVGDRDRISGVRIDHCEGIIFTCCGQEISLRDYCDLLDSLDA